MLAFRLARHHVTERAPDARTAAFAALQDTPPGSAATALAARADVGPEAMDELILVPSLRGAPHAVAPEEFAMFTEGFAPEDDEEAKHLTGNAHKGLPDDVGPLEALDRVSAAVEDALRGGPLVKDDFHQALRDRLPKELLWWCQGCQSHHVHPSLWRATGVRGVLAIVGREGNAPLFGAPPQTPPMDDPGGALARRYLQLHGPATPLLFRYWAYLTLPQAKRLLARAGELAPVGKSWVLAEDAELEAPPPSGARLLPNLDPLASAKDREILVPDEKLRKKIWARLGGPGMALVDGEVAALWRPRKKGKVLEVELEPVRELKRAEEEALAVEAERLAPFRGAERAVLSS